MGKSNLEILTDEIIVVSQTESAGEKAKNTDDETYFQQNNVLITPDYTVFFISSLKIQNNFLTSPINCKSAKQISINPGNMGGRAKSATVNKADLEPT